MKGLRFGVHIPNICPSDFDLREVYRVCIEADKLHFDSLWAGDHLLPPKPFGPVKIYEAATVLSYLAGRTQRIRLGTSVILPLRHPVLIANILSTLDNLADGRLNVGLGVGWYKEEFDANYFPFEKRGLMEKEIIDILDRLWTEDNVSYEGKIFKIKDVTVRPKPLQKPRPPIFLGGFSERTFARAAEQADGWISWCTSVEEFKVGIESIQRALKAIKKPEKNMEYIIDITTSINKDGRLAKKKSEELKLDYSNSIVGNISDCTKRVKQYVEAGASHIVFVPRPYGEEREIIDLIAEEIIPALVKK